MLIDDKNSINNIENPNNITKKTSDNMNPNESTRE